jgi:hypothetical protein
MEAILVVDQAVEEDRCHRHPDQDGLIGKQGLFLGAVRHRAASLEGWGDMELLYSRNSKIFWLTNSGAVYWAL